MTGSKLCRIALTLGWAEPCPEEGCPFWEAGGAALAPGCALERLRLDLARQDLAEYLVDLRRELERARDEGDRDAFRKAFSDIVPPDLSGR